MTELTSIFTSTGSKFFAHEEAMNKLRNGRGQPIVTHVMATDVCNHSCAFCSVQHRAGDSLPLADILAYVDILLRYDLKAVILSGGGNPILYRDKKTGKGINELVYELYARGLDIGMITNGMPLRKYEGSWSYSHKTFTFRESWQTVKPETLDRFAWVRISMSGFDHEEREVYVPDIDPTKTTLGFSYVAHDVYIEPADTAHGRVSRPLDLISGDRDREANIYFEERVDELTEYIGRYTKVYKPRYVRLLPNCLEPGLIDDRCKQLELMASKINFRVNRQVAFVQRKPPAPPKACYLGYVHPVLNCDGYVYPCDSCVLNEAAGHSFASGWRMCHWSDIAGIYERPVASLIADPAAQCPGCVFPASNEILRGVVEGRTTPLKMAPPEHVNFV